jgi:hypothetical protein
MHRYGLEFHGYTMAPPHQIPLISIPFDLARNKNYAGNAIIPDNLKNVDPEYQYTTYTSKLAKMIGQATHQSPILIDYWVKGLFSSNARYGLQGADAAIDAVQGNPTVAMSDADKPIVRRFNVDPNRSSNEATDFYGLAAKDDGKFSGKKATFDRIRQTGTDAEAVTYLNKLKPDERAYVVATSFSDMIGNGGKNAMGVKMPGSMFHPIVRAQEAANVITGIERDVSDATLSTMRGQKIELTPQQRRDALDALASLRVAEMRNALIATGQEGWKQKQAGDRLAAYAKLQAIDPRLPDLVKGLQDEQGIPRPDVARRGWNQLRPVIEGEADEALFDKALMAKRLQSSDRRTKREALIHLMQGAR